MPKPCEPLCDGSLIPPDGQRRPFALFTNTANCFKVPSHSINILRKINIQSACSVLMSFSIRQRPHKPPLTHSLAHSQTQGEREGLGLWLTSEAMWWHTLRHSNMKEWLKQAPHTSDVCWRRSGDDVYTVDKLETNMEEERGSGKWCDLLVSHVLEVYLEGKVRSMVSSWPNNAVDKADGALRAPLPPTTFKAPQISLPRKKKKKNTHTLKPTTPPPSSPLFSYSPPPSLTPFPPQPLSVLQDFAVQTRNRCLPGPCWKTPLFWMPATCFSFRDEGSQLAFLWSQFQKKKKKEGWKKTNSPNAFKSLQKARHTVYSASTPFCVPSTVWIAPWSGCSGDRPLLSPVVVAEAVEKSREMLLTRICLDALHDYVPPYPQLKTQKSNYLSSQLAAVYWKIKCHSGPRP